MLIFLISSSDEYLAAVNTSSRVMKSPLATKTLTCRIRQMNFVNGTVTSTASDAWLIFPSKDVEFNSIYI